MRVPAPRQIVFINSFGDVGGAERALLDVLEGLDRSRFAPTVICTAPGRLSEVLAEMGIPSRLVPLGSANRLSRYAARQWRYLPGAALGMAGVVRRLAASLKELRADLVHTNGLKAHLVGGLAGRFVGRPVVWHVQDIMPPGRGLSIFRAASDRLPRRIICISKSVEAQFAGRASAGRTRLIHNAVNLDHLIPERDPSEVRASLGIPGDAVVLAMVAHMTAWKGHMVFLEVMANLVRQDVPLWGLIIGGSIYKTSGNQDYEAEVHQRSRDLGLEHRVVFTGFCERVVDPLNSADILVHPTTRPEPFGIAVLEAMALGKPVIASADGGHLESVEGGVTGILVSAGETAGFTAAVRSLACDPERRLAMGQAGRQRVIERFTSALQVRRVESVYEEIFSVA